VSNFTKNIRLLALTLLILIPFQNCGQDYAAKESFFTGSEYEDTECLSDVVDCGAREEFLQISIDVADPADFRGLSSEFITGRCNTGNYPETVIRWEIHDSSGAVVSYAEKANACEDGMWGIEIPFTGVAAGQLYSIYVKIFGVDGGERYQNVMVNGSAEVSFSK
jgi:hypothetical protein